MMCHMSAVSLGASDSTSAARLHCARSAAGCRGSRRTRQTRRLCAAVFAGGFFLGGVRTPRRHGGLARSCDCSSSQEVGDDVVVSQSLRVVMVLRREPERTTRQSDTLMSSEGPEQEPRVDQRAFILIVQPPPPHLPQLTFHHQHFSVLLLSHCCLKTDVCLFASSGEQTHFRVLSVSHIYFTSDLQDQTDI